MYKYSDDILNVDVTFDITPTNVKIYNSYKIRTYEAMNHTLSIIRLKAAEKGIVYKRTIKSWIREWRAHNLLYDLHLFISHTKDVDLNEDESKIHLLIYSILSWFYLP